MISVIVPIHNVEKQLQRCIESLKNIGTPSVEFLLVDDGSTDDSGRIADEVNDPRFRVFHTENRGLSAARNYGIEHANGEWLMFVDSDDWVEPGFCSIPLQAAKQYDADLIVFQNRNWKNGHVVPSVVRKQLKRAVKKLIVKTGTECPIGILTKEESLQFGGAIAWNKLYHRDLFIGIRYPVGRVYEDIATTHKLIYRAKRIALIPDILYNYVYRSCSISQTKSEKNIRDGFLSAQERYDFLADHNYSLQKNQIMLWHYAFRYLIGTTMDDEVVRQAEAVVDSIPGYPKELKLRKKMLLAAWRIDKRLFYAICGICGKKCH